MGIYDRLIKCYDAIGIDISLEDERDLLCISLDSISFVSLTVEIESEFDILFPNEYIDMEYFLNPKVLVNVITHLLEVKNEC